MRIVTRPDFDGVVCAALISQVEPITEPTLWVQPSDMQKGRIPIQRDDIIANLPYGEGCALWFDHHYTNTVSTPFKGSFRVAPSAAGLVHAYYESRFQRDYRELVRQTDRIDAAELSEDEVRRPEQYPFVLLSMTISGQRVEESGYWNRLAAALAARPIEEILQDPEVRGRCEAIRTQNARYGELLKHYTTCRNQVSVTDFRGFDTAPEGNRFLVSALFPDAIVSVKIRYDSPAGNQIILSVGHSIFNRRCRVNAGLLLSRFEGGGHRGAASCTFAAHKADEYIPRILAALEANQPNEPPPAP